jgi:hypothetical protein
MVYLYLILRLVGAVAQLGARLNGIQKVVGSNPISSIFRFLSVFCPLSCFFLSFIMDGEEINMNVIYINPFVESVFHNLEQMTVLRAEPPNLPLGKEAKTKGSR